MSMKSISWAIKQVAGSGWVLKCWKLQEYGGFVTMFNKKLKYLISKIAWIGKYSVQLKEVSGIFSTFSNQIYDQLKQEIAIKFKSVYFFISATQSSCSKICQPAKWISQDMMMCRNVPVNTAAASQCNKKALLNRNTMMLCFCHFPVGDALLEVYWWNWAAGEICRTYLWPDMLHRSRGMWVCVGSVWELRYWGCGWWEERAIAACCLIRTNLDKLWHLTPELRLPA